MYGRLLKFVCSIQESYIRCSDEYSRRRKNQNVKHNKIIMNKNFYLFLSKCNQELVKKEF